MNNKLLFRNQLTILGVDSAQATNNKFINPNPAGMNDVNGDQNEVEAANSYPTDDIYERYNQNAILRIMIYQNKI